MPSCWGFHHMVWSCLPRPQQPAPPMRKTWYYTTCAYETWSQWSNIGTTLRERPIVSCNRLFHILYQPIYHSVVQTYLLILHQTFTWEPQRRDKPERGPAHRGSPGGPSHRRVAADWERISFKRPFFTSTKLDSNHHYFMFRLAKSKDLTKIQI